MDTTELKKMGSSKFSGQDSKSYWRGLDLETAVKTLAKMFREITHMKPPRGRTGRHLSYEGHYAVETRSAAGRDAFAAIQGQFYHEFEMTALENKDQHPYNPAYNYEESFDRDLDRLARWHAQHTNKLKVENTVGGLQDLVQGLMGLGLRDVEYDTYGYGDKKYQATMRLDGFYITIREEGE